MADENISDLIERYLKEILADNEQVKIRRSEIAGLFDVVPSQINYVINTRFTIQNGYIVESKRGGGGYIRIEKVRLLDDIDVLDSLIAAIGNKLSKRDSETIVQTLYNNDLINRREASIILAAIDKDAIDLNNNDLTDIMRANIMISILNRLRYEG
ncbi:CtsR family transcriptional regulator [Lentilactobacillus sp. TOM.63]|uniref:Transcriptional regulator CtsR n=2 Tax=Lentilactobacillus rapi TaxID=481723 RepID=A0A512PKK6_9LACO|nr:MULTISPECIES: CtsR family transcriptional regulator [Lentilactobacillus]MDM7516975.1 CtsR family transcriptional regulator [Lentilactobacillus sp. TOM.63]GEP71701.1 transcriptional regulator CtsR [Lentilactobacillus rapi]